ncbi:hypothetical protein HN011_011476 [Eciton burchellii]|nr:hypothetical protein HN011_011476 [Eciton burchellii]
MEKSINNEREDIENPKSAVITANIKQFVTLRKLVEKSNREVRYWRNQMSKLLESNNNIEANYVKLVRKVSDIDAKISANTKIHAANKQELKDLQNARANMSHKQWNDCLSETGNYANYFSQWITEYSRDVLLKEIENHREECAKVGEELTVLKQELNDMRKKCDSDYIRANVDDDLANLDGVISGTKLGNNNLMHNIRLTEDTLNKIQTKIKQSKIAINKYKIKEKNEKNRKTNNTL